MGQCVTKCKNPTSSLGSKSGEKDAGKSHGKKGGGGTGSAHKEEVAKSSADVIFNGTKVSEVTVEGSTAPAVSADVRRELSAQDGDGVSLARIDELFLCYKDEHEDAILEEGMERFCNDLREFVDGCKAIQADSIPGICSRFSMLLEESRGEESFKDLYRFTFQFGLDAEQGQRSLQRSIAIALWRLVFTLDTPPLLERWLDFLSENPCAVRGISRDTWNMFLNFTQSIGQDLSNYSEDEAWPSLFDSFVEWETERRRREQSDADSSAAAGGETDCEAASVWPGS
ncbi:DCN1 3 [Labeo rohita]|uniref:DCN1-like protein n=1 Tax=Labeo rohita TaxID=84645 RepID=A0A498N2G6_LABRO|nr:DCN1 3 [Labeo rohita]